MIKRCIMIGIFIILLSCFLIVNEPLIELKGREEVNLNLNDEYVEQGYIGKTRTQKLTKNVIVENNINHKKVGTYEIKYKLTYLFNTKTVIRKVNVVDNIKPEITLKGKTELILCPNEEYQEEGY